MNSTKNRWSEINKCIIHIEINQLLVFVSFLLNGIWHTHTHKTDRPKENTRMVESVWYKLEITMAICAVNKKTPKRTWLMQSENFNAKKATKKLIYSIKYVWSTNAMTNAMQCNEKVHILYYLNSSWKANYINYSLMLKKLSICHRVQLKKKKRWPFK